MKLDSFIQPREDVKAKRIAVAAAEGEEVLTAVADAVKLGIVEPILVGDEAKIKAIIEEKQFDLGNYEIVHRDDHTQAAKTAVELIRNNEAQVLMKGVLVSNILMHEILNRETGIRASDVLNHVSLIDSPNMDRLIYLSDGGMVPVPDFKQKIDIINNTVKIARNMGVEMPKVAVLAALELVNPKMPATTDAANLAIMSQRGQFKNCIVDGPFQLDNAISEVAVEEKGLKSPVGVAGHADILIVPNLEAGNILLKGLRYMGGCGIAGMMAGAMAPVVMSSRADSALNKLRSIACAIYAAD